MQFSIGEPNIRNTQQVGELLGGTCAGDGSNHRRLGCKPGKCDGDDRDAVRGGDLIQRGQNPDPFLVKVGTCGLGTLALDLGTRTVFTRQKSGGKGEVWYGRKPFSCYRISKFALVFVALHQIVMLLQSDVPCEAIAIGDG